MLTQVQTPILILGGAHSGKSQWSMQYLAPDREAIVIATADPEQLSQPGRIAFLQAMRPSSWETKEEFRDLPLALADAYETVDQVLIDSLNQWLGSIVLATSEQDELERASQNKKSQFPYEERLTKVMKQVASFIDLIKSHPDKRLVLVASEVGHAPPTHRSVERLYRQVVGLTLQRLAEICPHVVALTAGFPRVVKGENSDA